MSIFLVRHAESEANVDETLFRTTGDHRIALTSNGKDQANKVGEFLDNYLDVNMPQQPVRLWASPYRRTTQTAQHLQKNAPRVEWEKSLRSGESIFYDPRLREREFGYFNGLNDDELSAKYPDQWQHYKMSFEESGFYYAKPYGGESGANVCERLATFKETLWRDINNNHKHHVIVNHGFTLRCFVTSFLSLHPDAFAKERNPSNTAVRLLDIDPQTNRYADYGYIYDPKNNIALMEKPKTPIIHSSPA